MPMKLGLLESAENIHDRGDRTLVDDEIWDYTDDAGLNGWEMVTGIPLIFGRGMEGLTHRYFGLPPMVQASH